MKSLAHQLQLSLALIFAFMIIVLLTIASTSTQHLLQKFAISRLSHEAENLQKIITNKPLHFYTKQTDPIYITPLSGRYFQITQGSKVLYSPSLAGYKLPAHSDKSLNVQRNIAGPDGQRLFIWSKAIDISGKPAVLSIAEDMTEYKKHLRHFRIAFAVIGIIGMIAMLLLQRYIIRRLFKHLDHTRLEVKQIEAGKLQKLSEDVPSEIYPLVKEFNHSMSIMQQRMERSRNSLGNLAHALKTPLSLLLQQLDKTNINPENAKKQAERIQQLTERELKRARMAGLGNTKQRFDPRQELPVLVDVLKQAHQKPDLNIYYHFADNISTFGDREDMLELLGNLLDNACKWADKTVECTIEKEAQNTSVIISIEDDGKGIASQALEKLTQRGTRLDEQTEGHGLGLAICQDIVKLYAGSIQFSRSKKLGGFKVLINLP